MSDYDLGIVAALIAPTDPIFAWELAESVDDQEAFFEGATAMSEALGNPE